MRATLFGVEAVALALQCAIYWRIVAANMYWNGNGTGAGIGTGTGAPAGTGTGARTGTCPLGILVRTGITPWRLWHWPLLWLWHWHWLWLWHWQWPSRLAPATQRRQLQR